MSYATGFNFADHQYEPYPQSARPAPAMGVWDLVSLPSSPQILCFNSNSTYPTLEPDQRMSWVWPRVLEAEVEWTQQKKRYCEGADKVPNIYITIPSPVPKTNLAAFPQTSFLLSIDSVYLHFIQMQMIFTLTHSSFNHSFVSIFEFLEPC